MSAPSLAAASEASRKPRWLRIRIATPSPSPTPSWASESANALLRRSISANVSSPSSSITPTRSGKRSATALNPPATPIPHCCSASATPPSVTGECGRMTPDSVSTFSVTTGVLARSSTRPIMRSLSSWLLER